MSLFEHKLKDPVTMPSCMVTTFVNVPSKQGPTNKGQINSRTSTAMMYMKHMGDHGVCGITCRPGMEQTTHYPPLTYFSLHK